MVYIKVATTLYGSEERLPRHIAWDIIKRVEYYLGKAGVKWEEE